jgi:hypothetical protein
VTPSQGQRISKLSQPCSDAVASTALPLIVSWLNVAAVFFTLCFGFMPVSVTVSLASITGLYFLMPVVKRELLKCGEGIRGGSFAQQPPRKAVPAGASARARGTALELGAWAA